MWILWFVHFLYILAVMALYVGDVGTDGYVTNKFLAFSKETNASNSQFLNDTQLIEDLQTAIEECKTGSQAFLNCFVIKFGTIRANHQPRDQDQFGPRDWSFVFYFSLVHMILPYILFCGLGLYFTFTRETEEDNSRRESGKCARFLAQIWKAILTICEIFLFPIYIKLEKLYLEIKLTKLMAQNEYDWDQDIDLKEVKEKLQKKLERNEEKEILATNIEVSSESSPQFYIQMLLSLTPIIIQTILFAQTESSIQSFGSNMVSLETLSIASSFLAMALSYYRIRNRTKKNALSGKSALVNFLLTTLETISRILLVWLVLYLTSEDKSFDPILAIEIYYGHVAFMLLFNFIFNEEAPTLSVPYFLGLFFNSLSNTYTNNYYSFHKLLWKGVEREGKKVHQPSLLRQIIFQLCFFLENITMTIIAISSFEGNATNDHMTTSDGYQGHFSFSRGNLHTIIAIVWGCQAAAWVLRILYYALHPAAVSVTKLGDKMQVISAFCDNSFT